MLACLAGAVQGAPQLFAQPAHQSPVRGAGDDLLLLAGDGLERGISVWSASTTNPAFLAPEPDLVGAEPVEVVAVTGAPHAVVVRLPPGLRDGDIRRLRVRDVRGQWSAPVTINDPRPLWFSPSFAYATQKLADLPRTLRIVGRNLRPSFGASLQVRLQAASASLALPTAKQDDATGDVLLTAKLPSRLDPGRYRVQVGDERAGWIELDEAFEVLADRAAPREFAIDDAAFGGCRPDDGRDDTACMGRAIDAARFSGGGMVRLRDGTWDLADGAGATLGREGLVLPPGVGVLGNGAVRTRLHRHADWNVRTPSGAAFTLLGENRVEGLRMRDLKPWRAGDPDAPFLRLGRIGPDGLGAGEAVRDVVVTATVFDRTHPAIADAGVPLSRIFITYNLFGAWDAAIRLSGNRFEMQRPFRLDDSVIRDNVFMPGEYLDESGDQGTLASEIGASRRLDFSGNVADGSATDFVDPAARARGWRAAFFWHMNNNHERLLVAQNRIQCSGDLVGDGEAIAFDNNANTYAFREPARVRDAGPDWIEVEEPMLRRQNGRELDPAVYYREHWLQVVDGRGLGQARRIQEVTSVSAGRTRLTIAPPWDVVPASNDSRVMMSRKFWQAYVVGNVVDQRTPLCRKSNRTREQGGVISMWASTADSLVGGNVQYDTDGILYQQSYTAPDAACADCAAEAFLHTALDVRGNRVEGEYDWQSDCSGSGIQGSHSASRESVPPTVAFGINVSGNRVRRADGLRGGAISTPRTWYAGAAPHRWPLVQNTLIHHNQIADIEGAPPLRVCGGGDGGPRAGIALPDARLIWNTVLHANRCERVALPLRDEASATTRLCSAPMRGAPDSCECARDEMSEGP